MISNETTAFHESTIVEFYSLGDDIYLLLDDAMVEGQNRSVEIKASKCVFPATGPSRSPEKKSLMTLPDGEVLTLKITDTTLYLLVLWTDFEQKESETSSIDIVADAISATELPSKSEVI